MAKKKTLDTTAIIFIGIAVLGLILSIVGMFTPWLVNVEAEFAEGLFSKGLTNVQEMSDKLGLEFFPIGVVRTFGIIALICAVVATALVILEKFGIFKIEGLIKLIVAVGVIAVAVLLLVFAIVYITDINNYMTKIGTPAKYLYNMGIAMFLLPIGTAGSGVAYLLNK